jgi:hypothetical protein
MIGVDRLCCTSMGEAVAHVLQRLGAECAHRVDDFGGFAARLQLIREADEAKDRSDLNTSTQSVQ